MANKYAKELEKEKDNISSNNPFRSSKKKKFIKISNSNKKNNSLKKTPHYSEKEKPTNYFSLILGSDYEDLELDIRGLRWMKYQDKKGKEQVILERREDHYLSEDGANDIITKLKGHLSTDIKLAFFSNDEFMKMQDILRSTLYKYIKRNLYKLGMDTEAKQRNARPLFALILNRIRAVYSQSIGGATNKSSHGDITLSGGLDMDRDEKFKMENAKN